MPTVNEKLFDDLVEHNLKVDRVAAQIRTVMVSELEKTSDEVRDLVMQLNKFEQMNKLTKKYDDSIARVQQKIAKVRAKGFKNAKVSNLKEFEKLSQVEAEFIKKALERNVPEDLGYSANAVAGTKLKNIVAYGAFSGDNMSQWYRKWQVKDLDRIMHTIRSDLAQGQTVHDIERHLFGTRAAKYTDGVMQGTRNDAEVLARTVTNGVANSSRQEFYEANSDIISKVMVTVVLDGRTCPYCLAEAGKLYDVNDPSKPEFPWHPSNRTTYTPVVDGIGIIGTTPSVGGKNFRKAAKEDYLAEWKNKGLTDQQARDRWNNLSSSYKNKLQNNQIKDYAGKVFGNEPADITGEKWLAKQSNKLQEDVLGVEKAKLFRKEGITLSEMIVANRRKMLTVDQLKEAI